MYLCSPKLKEMKQFVFLWMAVILPFCAMAQEVLTLEQCRQLAIANNKELKVAGKLVDKAKEERHAARTKYFPQVSAVGTYIRNSKDIELVDYSKFSSLSSITVPMLQKFPELGLILPQVMEKMKDATHLDIRNVWIGDVSLVQPVFMGGKIVSYNQITTYARELAESMHDTKLQDVIYRTDETYWQVISLVNKKKLADAYVDLLRKMDNDITAMIQEGVATKADGLTVKVKLNEAEMAQNKVDNGLALSRMLLAQICGLEMGSPIALADEEIDYLTVQPVSSQAHTEEAFSNRPELKSLELATKIYRKKEQIALAEMLPSVALTANYLITNPNSHNGFKNEFSGMYNVGVMVKVPLSGWWEGTYRRNSAKAETVIKKLELEDAREKIELQVNQSVYKVNEAGKQLTASTKNMEKAEENLRYANLGFEEGVIPALNLMEAQTAWVSARSQLIDAQIEVKLTEVYLRKALGKLTK